jgi:hypothetical protein
MRIRKEEFEERRQLVVSVWSKAIGGTDTGGADTYAYGTSITTKVESVVSWSDAPRNRYAGKELL